MALHFDRSEFDDRKAAVIAQLNARELDGLLIFQQMRHKLRRQADACQDQQQQNGR